MRRIAVFAALRWECQPVLRQLRQVTKRRLDGFTLWQGHAAIGEVFLIKTGMGMQLAEQAARAVVNADQFDLFVSTGCAGALVPELIPGELVIATTVIDRATGHRYDTDAASRASWQATATRVALRTVLEPSLCSAQLLASVADRRALAAETAAAAVDMEGASIASCAADAGIPFALIRAILDTADVDLTATGGFIDPQTGAVKPLALAAQLVRHPGMVPQLLAMQRMMSAAQQSLNTFFAAWLRA